MKKTTLNLMEKAIKYVSINCLDGASAYGCYEGKMSDELKKAILSKKNDGIRKN